MQNDDAHGLIRGLGTLRRGHAVGVLTIESRRGRSLVAIEDGLPVAVWSTGDDSDSLGDLLLQEGALDLAAHRRAFSAIPPRGPVGPWLERVGATSRMALAYACRQQLRQRVQRLILSGVRSMSFQPGSSDVGLPALTEPAPLGVLLLRALRELGASEVDASPRRALGAMELRLTDIGEALVEGAALWPEEQAMLHPLRAGADAETVRSVGGRSLRGEQFLMGLMRVEGVAPRRRRRAYPMLMRKRREVRAAVGGRRLLELGEGDGPADARRALRRFARSLHPDHFHEGPLRQASEEVFSAMVRAAADLGA